MKLREISIEVENGNNVDISLERRNVTTDISLVGKAYSDYNFTYNEITGELELTLIANDKRTKTIKVDLPAEELVKDISYDVENKEINVEWQNGETYKISLKEFIDIYKADNVTLLLDEETKTFKINEEYLQNKYVPQELDIFSNIDTNKDRSKLSIFVDEEGTPKKVSMRAMLDTKIRTVNEVPNDLQENEYIFLEIK